MKSLSRLSVVLSLCLAIRAQAQNLTTYRPVPTIGASKARVVGTSTTAGISEHEWSVESPMIGGWMELDSAFLKDPASAKPGKVNAKVEVIVSSRALKSGKTQMDNVMYDALKATAHPKIAYRLTELTLKETPKAPDAPLVFDSKGELAVAGVTNQVAFPVTITRMEKDQLKVAGTVALKMSAFKVVTRPPKIALGLVKTGDDIKISFDWLTAKADGSAESAAK
jgi:polyisoprenoid-binding protein YceI